jgi:hypothetical protein
MKRFLYILLTVFLVEILIYPSQAYADLMREIKVNNAWIKIMASGRQTESTNRMSVAYAPVEEDFWEVVHTFGLILGVVNWQGPDDLVADPVGRRIRLAGAPFGEYTAEEALGKMFPRPVEGTMIRKYYKYQPSEVVVDGLHLEPPMMSGEIVAPAYIKNFAGNTDCTADVIVESSIGTWMGLDIHARYLAWTSAAHDDYIVYDWTFVNTGNTDEDTDIELPGESLDSLYIMRQAQFMPKEISWGTNNWTDWWGVTPEQHDSIPLRAQFTYQIPTPGGTMGGTWALGFSLSQAFNEYDRGYIDESTDICAATIFAPQTTDGLHPVEAQFPNNPAADDSTQPRSNSTCNCNDFVFKYHSNERPKTDWITVYNVMKYGQTVNSTYVPDVYLMQDIPSSDPMHYWIGEPFPNTYHDVPTVDLPGTVPTDIPWNEGWHSPAQASFGPYQLEFGDSLRLVQVLSLGGLDARSCYEIGQAWLAETLRYEGPQKCPHKWYEHGLWMGAPVDDSATLAKDEWLFSVQDSVKQNALAAQWNFDNGYSAPVPPPPPEFFHVNSRENRIELLWGTQSEVASDFAGYRVYRALGNPGPTYSAGSLIGEWELIYQCGGVDPGGGVTYSSLIENSFDDTTALRGQDYYYYVVAIDEGGETDYRGTTGPLESSKWLTKTTLSATLSTPACENLDSIRVVPNPYSMRAGKLGLQYVGAAYKLMLVNLPPLCTIKIYNESGDLVRTLDHTNGSGGEAWAEETQQYYLTTDSGQMVVSGIYIAHITTPEGKTKNVKFVIVR